MNRSCRYRMARSACGGFRTVCRTGAGEAPAGDEDGSQRSFRGRQMKKQKHYERNLCEGSLYKGILLFSLPLVFSNLLQVLFTMADVAVVGRYCGPEALGSVGSTTILITLFTGRLMGLGGAVNVVAARYMGAGNRKSLRETVHTAAVLCFLAGVLMLLVEILFGHAILRLLRTREELIGGALLYIRIYFLGMPAMGLFNFGNAVLSASGDTRRPLCFLSIAGVVNVILNLLFVVGMKRNVDGVAMASVISQCISAGLVLRVLLREDADYRLRLPELRITPRIAKNILSLGIPAALQNAVFAIANLFVQAGVNSFPAIVVEGNSAATNADALVYDSMAAVYTACASFMSQNYGADRHDRVRKSYRISLLYSWLIGSLIGLSLVLSGRPFLGLFTKEEAVIAEGMHRLRVMGFSYGISAFMDCTIAASRALGRGLVPTIIVVLGSCVFRVLWIFTVFRHFRTIESIYLLYSASWTITAIAEIAYYLRISRKLLRKS